MDASLGSPPGAPEALARLRAARAAVADALLAGDATPVDLGSVRLRPHQAEAVARARAALATFGGTLIADDVGLGKTFVALALARDAASPLVVCPAGLRAMWREAMSRSGVPAPLLTFEALSRGGLPDATHDIVIVDEAHHARSVSARRFDVLARLCSGAKVVLLSATPVHNRRRELHALLSLFLGERAHDVTDAALSRIVVRRRQRDLAGAVPAVAEPRWLVVDAADDLLDDIVALPPPLPPSGAGDGGSLLAHGLVRQWASSDGALRAALRRRLGRAAALEAALEAGRYPTGAELGAWACGDDAVQLAFPELMAEPPAAAGAGDLLAVVRAHSAAVRRLFHRADASRTDAARAARLREVRAAHPGEKVLAFSCFAETVVALSRHLRADGGVAALTADGAQVAGGPLTRADALARFAPRAHGTRPVGEAERIDLLLTTDLLSEGVSLQDASVVVHLDLPWTPARLQQRVGRVARMGSEHSRVAVYALRPPASAEAMLRAERHLANKLQAAARAVGVTGAILPGLAPPDGASGAPEHAEALRRRVATWRADEARAIAGSDAPAIGAARAAEHGFLAACLDAGEPRLLAVVGALAGGEVTDAPEVVAHAAALAEGPACEPLAGALALARSGIAAWRTRRQVAEVTQLESAGAARLRRRLLARIARTTRRAPPHQRPAASRLGSDARLAAAATCGRGAERVLAELADADMPDMAWLTAVGAFAAVQARTREPAGDFRVLAIILLQR